MKKRFVVLALCFALLACSIACNNQSANKQNPSSDNSSQTEVQPSSDGTAKEELVIAATKDLEDPVWFSGNSSVDHYYYNFYYETLMRFDKNGDVYPYLAESLEEDIENLRYIIKLRKGIKFHDGTELNAEACKFCLDKYKEEGILKASAASLVTDIEILDEYTVAINLSQWDSVLPSQLARNMGFMASKTAYETLGHDGFAEAPAGTGPYKLVEREFEASVTFEKFEDYWQGEPIIDKAVVRVIADDSIAMAALEMGEIDAFFPSSYEIADYLEAEGFNIVVAAVPSSAYTLCFDMSHEDDPLHDIRVRQAVAYAIDREAVVNAIFGKYGVITNQYATPTSPYYNPDVEGYTYNPEKAKALLAEAGYPDGFTTRISICSSSTTDPSVRAQQIVAEQLKAVGITAEINLFEGGQWTNMANDWAPGMLTCKTTYANGTPSMIAMNYRHGLSNVLGTDAFVVSDKLDDLVVRGMAAPKEEAIELFKQAQKIIFDDDCMVKVLCLFANTAAVNPKLMDSGIGEVTHLVPGEWTLWTAYFAD